MFKLIEENEIKDTGIVKMDDMEPCQIGKIISVGRLI